MGEKSEPAAKSSIAVLKERALDLIALRPEGIYQSDLRRLLEIDSSKCSKVVARLQSSGLISREKVPASSTYLLKLSSGSAQSPAISASSPAAKTSITNPSPDSAQSPTSAPSAYGGNEGGSEEMENELEDLFDSWRSVAHHSHIDTYLTEIYLLYLTRAT